MSFIPPVQSNISSATPSGNPATSTQTYTSAGNTLGNTSIVALMWSPSSINVTSVVDTKLNSYALAKDGNGNTAFKSTSASISYSVAIYVAYNIAASTGGNSNTVTVHWSANASTFNQLDQCIAEYPPLLSCVAVGLGTGNGTAMTTSQITTKAPPTLSVAFNAVDNSTSAVGGGFTQVNGNTGWSDAFADRNDNSIATFTPAYTQSPGGVWVMVAAVFTDSVVGTQFGPYDFWCPA